MICCLCKKNEAVVSVEQVLDGNSKNIYLCDSCAKRFGLGVFSNNIDISITNLFKNQEALNQKQVKNSPQCPCCGKNMSDIVSNKTIGCAECFSFFKKEILSILRTKKKNIIYAGQIPFKPTKEFSKKISLMELKKELKIAVENEEYEKAAILRDKLKFWENNDIENS